MPTVLSTKILNNSQKQHLFSSGIGLVEYEALKIKALKPNLKCQHFKNAIFTSQNAVRFAIEENVVIENAFCVGEKTAELIKHNHINLIAQAENAKALANEIIKKYPDKSFDFFCSKQRREELPYILKSHNIEHTEHHLYESICNFKSFLNDFDAVLCFSPLGVKAYYDIHKKRPLAICIGITTANAAKKYSTAITLASKSSIDSVIIKTIKTLKAL